MKSYKKILIILTLFISPQTFAQQLIPFQARLSNGAGAVVTDGIYVINFAIYDTATGGAPVNGWVESHSNVSVISGVVNVLLGSVTPLSDPNNDGNTSDALTFYTTDGERFIGVTIGTGQEMVPRHQLIQSFHAVAADNAANLGNKPPSFYSTVADHDTDLQQLSLASESAIQQSAIDHGVDIQEVKDLITQLDTLLVPTGTVMAFAGNATSVPAGWRLCDGASVLRVGTYANLFTVIGAAHGTGSGGTTTFSLPDYRGRFLRGQDLGVGRDPDAASRTDRGDGIQGDNVGTKQGHELGSHTHDVHYGNYYNNYNNPGSSNAATADKTLTSDATGGSETRPINIYVNYIIKY